MNEKDLQKALTDINPEYILEADPDQGKTVPFYRRGVFRGITAAAAACLLLAAGWGAAKMKSGSGKEAVPQAVMEKAGEAYDACDEMAPADSMNLASEPEAALFGTEEETESETMSEEINDQ